jgi:predicted ATP-grasp superfamily ATP-dependent carboligase
MTRILARGLPQPGLIGTIQGKKIVFEAKIEIGGTFKARERLAGNA